MEHLIKLLNSKNYSELIKNLESSLGIDVKEDIPATAILNYDISKLKASKVDVNELDKLIEIDSEKILAFVKAKLKKYNNVKDKQEYPTGEEPAEEEKDIRIRILPFYRNFLIIYLIEYVLLKTNPAELGPYFNAIRIPNSKKYEKELNRIYNNL